MRRIKVGEKVIMSNPKAFSNGIGSDTQGSEGYITEITKNDTRAINRNSCSPDIYHGKFDVRGQIYQYWCLREQISIKQTEAEKLINQNYNI